MRKKILMAIALFGSLGLTACGGQILDKNAPNTVNLTRQFQRIVTYDCKHNVKSDSVETVASPVAMVEIPKNNPTAVHGSSIKNERNGAAPGMEFGYGRFQVDYSYGALNMHVESGENILDYKFYGCDVWGVNSSSGNPECKVAKTVIEEGTLKLNINYSEKTLDGFQERTDCPTPTPTPSPTPKP